MKLSLSFPVKDVTINQPFGTNDTPLYKQLGMKGHNGIDFYAPDGTPVLASHDGVVTYAGLDGSNGNLIVLMTHEKFDYLDGQAYYKTLYGHLKTRTFQVTAGQNVTKGQILALADNTGASLGSHLHFSVKPVYQGEEAWQWSNAEPNNGYNGSIDPAPFLGTIVQFKTPLKKGDTGFEVEKVQALLLRKGYLSPVPKLGYYGDATSSALLKFQIAKIPSLSWYEKYVLRGTVCGEKTLRALNLVT